MNVSKNALAAITLSALGAGCAQHVPPPPVSPPNPSSNPAPQPPTTPNPNPTVPPEPPQPNSH
ncbi:MAG TPA: hypothetical protein VGI65_16755 [Steroidobacteraceae bacterium]|jgi:hypothetical protein